MKKQISFGLARALFWTILSSTMEKANPTRLLLVEDNSGDARLIQELLAEAPAPGFQVEWRWSLETSLKDLWKIPLDLVLLDLSLPDASGLEAFRRISAETVSLPVVVLTGLDNRELAHKAMAEGAQDFLPKHDLSAEVLHRAIDYAIDRHDRESALRESEALFRIMANSAPVLLMVTDVQGKATFFNETWLGFRGRTAEEEAGDGWLEGMNSEDLEAFRQAFKEARTAKRPFQCELRIRRQDGQERRLMITGAPRVLGQEALRGYILTGLDLTEQQRAEYALSQAHQWEMMGSMAGGLANNFNNLLTGVLGNLDMAEMRIEKPVKVFRHLEQIRSAAIQATELTQHLLEYSGRGCSFIKRVDLNFLIQEARYRLGNQIPEHITVHMELEAGLPPMEADPTRIVQVIENLVTNSLEAIGDAEGTLTFRTKLFFLEGGLSRGFPDQEIWPGKHLLLELSDSGCGMPPELLGKVFEPFFSTKFTGRGLGLSSVLGILRAHHAGYRIQSTPGRGTRFQIYFPAMEGPVAETDLEL